MYELSCTWQCKSPGGLKACQGVPTIEFHIGIIIPFLGGGVGTLNADLFSLIQFSP